MNMIYGHNSDALTISDEKVSDLVNSDESETKSTESETPTPKTVTEQQQRAAEAAPKITLDTTPKTAAEVIEKANDGKCHAHRFQQGSFLSCTKKRGHTGHHKDGKRGWRQTSGDAADLRALDAVEHGEPGSEATA